jgi:DNA polymerase elongation subunit (family B)
MTYQFRLFDFNILNESSSGLDDSSDEENNNKVSRFVIQMFGINEERQTCSIKVTNYKPFFYVKVDDNWTIASKERFVEHIKQKVGKYYAKSFGDCKLIKRKKLYGFDAGKDHKFIALKFENIPTLNKVKRLWYNDNGILLQNGYIFGKAKTILYEANIPPLLRFFHIKDISPSGWIKITKSKVYDCKSNKNTHCDFEFEVDQKHVFPINDKEERVPYKICSFDIEASSSHGDFPVPKKSYKKLATNIIEYLEKLPFVTKEECDIHLKNIVLVAFGYLKHNKQRYINIDLVYPKKNISDEEILNRLIYEWINRPIGQDLINKWIEQDDEELKDEEEDDDDKQTTIDFTNKNNKISTASTIGDILCDSKLSRDMRLEITNKSLSDKTFSGFPLLEGDKVTFIGSTFLMSGSKEPYLNHCAVLNSCDQLSGDNIVIDTYETEKQVLIAWQKLIQKEDPDIIIGYNIFGFDYTFMFQRAEENNCVTEFLKLSRNKNEICGNYDRDTGKYKLEESAIVLASGQHDLKYIKMPGRIQIDLYNVFRREENLTSYKLDYVAGYFIGDYVKSLDVIDTNTTITTGNLTGLLVGSYVHFEEIGHSTDNYDDGNKFLVTSIDKINKSFTVNTAINPDMTKKVRWGLAKDDVSPKDIFKLTNGTSTDRSIIAKYCLQDCNLVHYIMNKVDTLTGMIEMSSICSVPMSFLILRGQGIKLTSYVAKKCREKGTLMPVIQKSESLDPTEDASWDGYDGAIVLDPKCDLYLDNPVACVDYASLYPSSMLSENLSHDSKVWVKEYNLHDMLISEWGERDEDGNYIYDNLDDYKYVDIKYDTYKWTKNVRNKLEKVISGYKVCRFAQFPNGSRGIMPSILEELLKARKSTRKLIPQQTDEFMKNVLDKRQLSYKITANSLYGQCGAKTSTFHEKDVAASTTATGRLLLTYAKRMIEETYGDRICETTKHGKVITNAEYIYGDTDSVFFTFNLKDLEGNPIRGKQALEITIELSQEAGALASNFLKAPHDLEYEKTFMPFCLLSKKRYVGMLYEKDPEKGKRNEMGIVLKRRDNAPIVKDVYGGIIDILMKQQDIKLAIQFLQTSLQNIVNENFPIDKLIITKSLRSGYKNPRQIAHKVLADRITSRDPGNKPSSGDRIPFVYIHNDSKKALQGDKIETPTFIKDNNVKIDYSFYITNQIMKPVQQLFALVLEKIWKMQHKSAKLMRFKDEVQKLRRDTPSDKFSDKLESLKNKEIKVLLFDKFLRVTNNAKLGNQAITSFFHK